jgi:hypothetical protein
MATPSDLHVSLITLPYRRDDTSLNSNKTGGHYYQGKDAINLQSIDQQTPPLFPLAMRAMPYYRKRIPNTLRVHVRST